MSVWRAKFLAPVVATTRTINNCALMYSGQSYDETEMQFIAEHFDVVLSGNPTGVKAYNPDIIFLQYTNTTNATAGIGLDNGLVDDDYVKVTSATAQQTVEGTTANHVLGDKIWSYGAGFNVPTPTRFKTKYFTDAQQQKIIDWHINNLDAGFDGWFDDNTDRGGSKSGSLDSGTCDGGFDATSGAVPLSTDNLVEGYLNDFKIHIDADFPSAMYYVSNTATYGVDQFTLTDANNYWWQIGDDQVNGQTASRNYPDGLKFSRGNFQEFMFAMNDTYNTIQGNYYAMEEIWTLKGSPANHLYIQWWERFGYGGEANNSDRVKLFAMGAHLHHQFEKIYFRYAGNGNSDPVNGDWFGAQAVNLGTPTGITQLDSNTYRREYTAGVVVVRYRLSSGDNYTDSGNYDLGATYNTVNVDGTTGASVSNVTLRNAEAFIGVA